MTIKIDECKLISGKEALIALANGENIQQNINGEWSDIRGDVSWRSILGGNYSLRLKPRTILINGIEVPAPFKPKDGDEFYFIDCETTKGCSIDVMGQGCDDTWIQFGAWRTEDEIKKVVAALRQVFGGSHDN